MGVRERGFRGGEEFGLDRGASSADGASTRTHPLFAATGAAASEGVAGGFADEGGDEEGWWTFSIDELLSSLFSRIL